MDICVVIPAFDPDEELLDYVERLIASGIDKIILIDDGSDTKCKWIFDDLSDKEEIELLTHAVNMGKGRALKDAFDHYLVHYANRKRGVITADCEGQHRVEDVWMIAQAMSQYPDALILGLGISMMIVYR